MARWQTETLLFRRALALVACWCLFCAVVGYFSHRAVPSYDQRAGYRESMQRCAGTRFEASPVGDLYATTPGRLVMADCTGRVRTRFLGAEAAEHRQVTVTVLIWALLPSALLLLFAAFAEPLRRLLPPRDPGRS